MTSFLVGPKDLSVMLPTTLPHSVSLQPCHYSKDGGDRNRVEHARPQRAMVMNAMNHLEYEGAVRSARTLPSFNSPVHRKDSYFAFVLAAALASRASFIAAAVTAINVVRRTIPYITKTIHGLPDSR